MANWTDAELKANMEGFLQECRRLDPECEVVDLRDGDWMARVQVRGRRYIIGHGIAHTRNRALGTRVLDEQRQFQLEWWEGDDHWVCRMSIGGAALGVAEYQVSSLKEAIEVLEEAMEEYGGAFGGTGSVPAREANREPLNPEERQVAEDAVLDMILAKLVTEAEEEEDGLTREEISAYLDAVVHECRKLDPECCLSRVSDKACVAGVSMGGRRYEIWFGWDMDDDGKAVVQITEEMGRYALVQMHGGSTWSFLVLDGPATTPGYGERLATVTVPSLAEAIPALEGQISKHLQDSPPAFRFFCYLPSHFTGPEGVVRCRAGAKAPGE